MSINLAVIGAASSYTPELFYNLAEDGNSIDVAQITLVDLNTEKVSLIASVCERLIKAHRLNLSIKVTTNVADGISGADFILPQIRSW